MDWGTATVRALLLAALDDPTLVALCQDYFPEVSNTLGRGMRKDEKVQVLLEYCVRHDCIDALITHLTRLNPGQVRRFAAQKPVVSLLSSSRMEPEKGTGAASVPAPSPAGVGNRWAVLVGVNTYDDRANYGQLHVCVRDVEAVRDGLASGGYDPVRIRLLTDGAPELPTRANILMALQAVANATDPDDLLLFYYSGHGEAFSGESYLVARDGRKLVLGDTGVPVARVRAILESAPARARVMVLDACHSGADIGGKGPQPMSADFIRRVFEEAEGLAVLASCK